MIATPRRAGLGWADAVLAAMAAVVLLAVYLRTLLPDVGTADTAELQLVAVTRGVAHPPGYPTWTLLASGLVHLVPWGSPAWRASLLSALASCGAAAMMCLALRGLGCRRSVAGALALALGLLPSIWRLSTAAEVYTLNLFFVAAIAACLVAAHGAARRAPPTAGTAALAPSAAHALAPEWRWILAAVGILALGLGNHPTVLTLAPAIVLLALWIDRRIFLRPRLLAAAAALVLLGAAQYAFIVARTFDPDTPYLGVDAGTAARLWEVIARNRHSLVHFSVAELVSRRVPLVLATLGRELWPLLPFAVFGAFLLRGAGPLQRRGLALPLLAVAAVDLALVAAYDIGDAEGYYFPASLIVVLLAGLGVERVIAWVDRQRAGLLALALPAALSAMHLDHADRSRDHPTTLAALSSLPRPVLLVSLDYDASQTFLYQAEMERRAGGELRVRHQPPAALDLAFGLDDLRRYAAGDATLRWSPDGRSTRPGLPLYLYAPRPEWRTKIDRLGLATEAAGEGMLRVIPDPSRATTSPLPQALLVGRLEQVRLLPQAIARLASPDFDPRSAVLRLGNGPPLGEPGAAGEARILTWGDSVVIAEVEAERAGWLLLTDTFSSRWEATLDGHPAPFRELDLLYWGVPVTAGRHRIEVRFLPHPFELGRWLFGPRPP